MRALRRPLERAVDVDGAEVGVVRPSRARYLPGRMLSHTAPLLRELEHALPDAPVRGASCGTAVHVPATNGGGPTFEVRSPDALRARAAVARPARARAAPTSPARSTWTTSTPCSRCSASWEPPPLERREQARLALAAARASASGARRTSPRAELRLRGRRHTPRARRTRGAPPLRRLERVLRAVPGRGDDLQLRDLLARRQDARGGAGDEARAGLHQARPEGGPARARRGLRLGQLRHPRGRAARRECRRHHALGAAGRARARSAWRSAASRTASRSACRTTARTDDGPFDAVSSIGMVEHVGSSQIDLYARQLARLVKPGGRVLNHGIARLRVGEPGARRVHAALRVPRRRPAPPVAHPARARARRARDAPRRGLPPRLRGDAAPLGAARSTTTSTRRSGSAAPSARASGGSTCGARAAASRRGFTSIYQVRCC